MINENDDFIQEDDIEMDIEVEEDDLENRDDSYDDNFDDTGNFQEEGEEEYEVEHEDEPETSVDFSDGNHSSGLYNSEEYEQKTPSDFRVMRFEDFVFSRSED